MKIYQSNIIGKVFIGNDYLPNELYYLILEFVAEDFEDILKFKSICKSWKFIGETSPLWLRIPLRVYCPWKYFKAIRASRYQNVDNFIDIPKKEAIDRFYPGNSYSQTISLGDPLVYTKVFRFDAKRERITNSENKVTENAKLIHDIFIDIYGTYNQKWTNYAGWLAFATKLKRRYHEILVYFIVLPTMALNTAISFLCIYLFQDYSLTSTHQSLQVKLGFFGLYLFLFLYVLCEILGIGQSYLGNVFRSTELRLHFRWEIMFPDIMLVTLFIGGIFSLVLWNLKACYSQEIEWTFISIPGWITCVAVIAQCYIFGKDINNNPSYETIAICVAVALAFLLVLIPLVTVGWAVDHHEPNLLFFWQRMTIMLYPIAFLLGIAVIAEVMYLFYFYYIFCWQGKTVAFHPDTSLPVSPRIMRFQLLWFTIHVIFAIACTFSFYILLILPWKDNWLTTFALVESLTPLGFVFLFLSCLHTCIIAGILSIVVDCM
jgi:hypothetical protein